MLVLSRKRGEQIVIGRDIVVTVLEVHHSRVKLGLLGPGGVVIHREEYPAADHGAAGPGLRRMREAALRSRAAPNHSICRRGQKRQPVLGAVGLQPARPSRPARPTSVPCGMSITRRRSISGNSAR